MGFPPPKGIYAGKLNAATPTPFNTDSLKTQLQTIGLDCSEITPQTLNDYITEVNAQLPSGKTQSFGILAPLTSPSLRGTPAARMIRPETNDVTSFAAAAPVLVEVATGNWTLSGTAQGYAPHLEIIQYPAHFQWLYANRATNGFSGTVEAPPASTGNFPNAEGIKKLFVQVCAAASATLVQGLDQSTMQAMLTNVISPLNDNNLSNYNVTDSRAIFLVDNYNQQTGYADGVGVLSIGWTLKITDYKRKTKHGGDTHPTNLQINAGSVLYTDGKLLCRDYNAVLTQFGINPNTSPACPVATS